MKRKQGELPPVVNHAIVTLSPNWANGGAPPGSARQAFGVASTARGGVLCMGRVEATELVYERSVFETNPAAARRCVNLGDSVKDWGIPLVREPDSPGLPPASEALGTTCNLGRS